MNIALGALIITILLLPGSAILKAYYTSLRAKDRDLHIPFTELLFRGLVFSFIIHMSAICIIGMFGYKPDFKLLYQLIIGEKFIIDNIHFTNSVLQFGLYNLSLFVFLFIITKLIKGEIVKRNYDIKNQGLRTSNYWFLIFSARYLDSNKKGRKEKTDLIWVDILATGKIVYSGFLFDFEYSADKDQLEIITLKNALKRTYRKTNEVEDNLHSLKLDAPRPIQGDAFVILAKDIININLYYLNVTGDINEAIPK